MSDRQQRFEGTRDVLEPHKFDVMRLDEYLKTAVENYAGPIDVKQFKGGQSNPTYLIKTPTQKYVLRRKPPGNLLKSAHAVDREYRVIQALNRVDFPVPEPYVYCDDESIIGTVFYVMEFVEGRIFWDLDMPDSNPYERAAIYDDLNKSLAKLHNFNIRDIGLSDFGKPGNYFSRQISRWSKQYVASEIDEIPAMNQLMSWLPENIPDDESSSIVHGDYRLDNLIIHPVEPKIIGVLDWELSTVGHPMGDLTYNLLAWQMPDIGAGSTGLFGKDIKGLGIPSEDEYIERYCERTGKAVGLQNREFYSAYNFFRIAAILQGIAGRVRDGTAASIEAQKLVKAVAPLAEMGWAYALKANA
ncbi:MAG: phosphotransferase family protein [Pseudomonadota bacterium]|nr:phosphotransferase family protein [Pseudomonadota bacterium]